MQYQIKKTSRLLSKKGKLIQKGYATKPILKYQRKNVAHKSRLKEWDYYLIYNKEHAVALTVGRSNSLLLLSASFINLKDKSSITKTAVRFVPKKKLTMPESSKAGDIHYQDSNTEITFIHQGENRKLTFRMINFKGKEDINVDMTLYPEPKDSMVIATPFKEKETYFYYNQKIIGMLASGRVILGKETFDFLPCSSFALLDWGRGCWPYHTTWYWGAAQGMIGQDLFGFNLGYGFGDTSRATENMLFMNGIASKLEDVTFHIPQNKKKQDDYMKPWKITSSDGRIQLTFEPILDRNAKLSLLLFSTDQHQVFGKFSGAAILDDGTIVFLQDFLGFAERVENRW